MVEIEKKQAALISVISNTSLIILKLIAGVISGSIGIISEAIHSASDLLASLITFFSVTKAHKPADMDHHFGHGKHEDLAGLIEGALIILAALYICYESIKKIIAHDEHFINADLALYVMLFSVVVNTLVSSHLFKVAKKTNSIALYADAEHLRTDIYSSLAVFIGLLFVKFTGNNIYDPIIALTVAVIIFLAGAKICKKSTNNLLDIALSRNENAQIQSIIGNHLGNKILELKTLRTTQAGFYKRIELTLIAEKTLQIKEAHDICDKIEEEIEEALKSTDITIHIEPND